MRDRSFYFSHELTFDFAIGEFQRSGSLKRGWLAWSYCIKWCYFPNLDQGYWCALLRIIKYIDCIVHNTIRHEKKNNRNGIRFSFFQFEVSFGKLRWKLINYANYSTEIYHTLKKQFISCRFWQKCAIINF